MDPSVRATGQTSKASDVFSFGILVIELFTDRQPFVYNEDGTFVEDYVNFFDTSSMPVEFAALARRCLLLNPKLRPSFTQIVESLVMNIEALQKTSPLGIKSTEVDPQ